MSTGATTLKEYVAKLGFKIDEAQLRNFERVFDKIEGAITGIAETMAVSAAVIDRHVNAIAENFEKLYYSAQQAGSKPTSLLALESGAQRIGFAAGEATAQVEAMASAIRSNPGLTALFGSNKDNEQLFLSTIKKLKGLSAQGPWGHTQAVGYASMLGLSESDLYKYEQGYDDMVAAEQKRRQKMQQMGLDPDKVAKESREFDNQLRDLMDDVFILKALLGEHFMPYVLKLVDGLIKIVDVAGRLDKSTGGVSTMVGGGLGIAAGVGFLPKLVRFMLRQFGLGGLAAEGAALEGGAAMAGEAAGGAALVEAAPVIAALVAGVLGLLGLGWVLEKTGALKKLEQWGGEALDKARSVVGTAAAGISGGASAAGGDTLAQIKAEAQRVSQKTGIAADLIFAQWQHETDNFRHIAAAHNLAGVNVPGGHGRDYRGFDSWDAFGDYFSYLMRPGGRYGGISGARTPAEYASILKAGGYYSGAEGDYAAGMLRYQLADRGMFAGGPTINQETHIEVNGSSDPNQTARAIGNEQARVNQEMTRNFIPRVN